MQDARAEPPVGWAGRSAWTVLDLAIAQPSQFFATWRAWRQDTRRPTMLHYVGVLTAQEASRWPTASERDATLLAQLQHAAWDLEPGFHRLLLEDGQISLTLCVGETKPTLDALHFAADRVYAPYRPQQWDAWFAKALARCCGRETQLKLGLPNTADVQTADICNDLAHAGFAVAHLAPTCLNAVFRPPWNLRNPRVRAGRAPSTCVVIGAGLAGASAAHALARRGWQVRVLEAASAPAAGASGLPAGIMVPVVTTDDSPRARMSRTGTRLMLQHARHLLREGVDWSLNGVEQRGERPMWHTHAGWICPPALVRAWLAQPGIEFCANAGAQVLEQTSQGWLVRGANGEVWGEAQIIVVANAMASKALLSSAAHDQINLLHPVHGTLSMGQHDAQALPCQPINGHGGLVSHVPSVHGLQWFVGATYDTTDTADIESAHSSNLRRLEVFAPEAALVLAPQFAAGEVSHWSGTRCVTHDRLPLVGPVHSELSDTAASLWMSVGMGSRGLSFAALCAELLVARLQGEPWPLPVRIARGLDARRARHLHAG